ncbi:Haloacid dehalogenase-like hydrolase (HAD) superfamily protein [Forsythia ovata]|uniref:Mitochondrial import inner membrane translocase subunit TIM50 n=1 Tax=Forsythia ovata TaxID=205694 RepID=A0ABD1T941_9LAMI
MTEKLKSKIVVSDDSSEDEDEKGVENELDLPLDKLNLGPKKKLLVLCLGGLLAHRVHVREKQTVRGLKPDVTYGKFLVFKRPFCTEFMKFCFDRFEVGLWSSARDHNIDAVLSCITGIGMKNKLAFVWGQDECTESGFYCLRKKEKPLFLKNLKDLWEKKYRSLPWEKGQYSSSNTLLIDDEPHTCLLNPPDTAIFPQPYKKHESKDTFLGPNGELRGFLEGLADADDVPTYVKEHRIGQPAITPSHPDWNEYVKIVRRFGKEEESAESARAKVYIDSFEACSRVKNLRE